MTKPTACNGTWRRLGAAFFMCALLTAPLAVAQAAAVPPPDVLTLAEAAELLRVGAGELERLALRNEVPVRRIGAEWRFNRDALMAWLNGDWQRIATLAPPGSRGAQPAPLMTPRELDRTTGTGAATARVATSQTGSTPQNAGETPIGEAPEEATAEDVFLRAQKILLAPGEAAADAGLFYARSDTPDLAVVGNSIGLATVKTSTVTAQLAGRVGIADETELFVSAAWRHQNSNVFAGTTRLASRDRSEFSDIRLGVRHTLLGEGPGRPNVIATLAGNLPTGRTSYAMGGGIALVKSFDPVVLFGVANYRHTFSRNFSDLTRLEPESRFDVTLGYALALNDTLTISTAVSGVFTGDTRFPNATLLGQDIYSLQLGLTSWLAAGLYIEPSVSFALSGPGNSVAFGLTMPYSF
jgi:excisionase family DNA binding protein